MNSFDGFTLTGANNSRYVPILGNSAGIIGAYRKAMGVKIHSHVKHYGKMELGLVPLFLLDGELSAQRLKTAIEKLQLSAYVAVYRPFDITLKNRYEEQDRRCRGMGFIKKDGSIPDWVLEDKRRAESIKDEYTAERIGAIQPYLDYEKAKSAYDAAAFAPPVDADTGLVITGDLNTFLYERAKAMFPFGVESILETNAKQSAIPKHRYFTDGLENAPVPEGVKQGGGQIALLDEDQTNIYDTIEALRGFFKLRLEQYGVVGLPRIVTHCAEMGLYKSSLTLYIIGAAFQEFIREDAVFYDGVCYWRYAEVRDISTWILRVYDVHMKVKNCSSWRAAMFLDDTRLKERLEGIFEAVQIKNNRHDTLGMTIVMLGAWIVEHLRYPIAFLDHTLHRLFREDCLYGDKLRQYAAYFSDERCAWLKANISRADAIARRKIQDAVGFDPDTTDHNMSRLPKGHYYPILFSAEDYIEALAKNPLFL